MKWWCASGTWDHSKPPTGFNYYVAKTATLEPRINLQPPVLRSLPDGGHLNRIGVRNPGLERTIKEAPKVPGHLVLSVLGFSPAEWAELAVRAAGSTATLELNLSCPNAEAKPVGTDPVATGRAVGAARRYYGGMLGAKLSPTVGRDVIRACDAEGVNYFCLCNTLDTTLGALSGRPLRALALDCIERASKITSALIVGGGGILSKYDGQAYLDAGADDLFMGTANLIAAPDVNLR